MSVLKNIAVKNVAWGVGGLLLGTAGKAILTSQDAKKVYTQCTAAVLRGKDCIMETTDALRENCGDIYADAEDINNARYAEAKEKKIAEAEAIIAAANEQKAEA